VLDCYENQKAVLTDLTVMQRTSEPRMSARHAATGVFDFGLDRVIAPRRNIFGSGQGGRPKFGRVAMVVTMCRTETMTGQTIVIDAGRYFH
jgi:hypothetical protein